MCVNQNQVKYLKFKCLNINDAWTKLIQYFRIEVQNMEKNLGNFNLNKLVYSESNNFHEQLILAFFQGSSKDEFADTLDIFLNAKPFC